MRIPSSPRRGESPKPAAKTLLTELSSDHERRLKVLVRAHSTPQKLTERASIILLSFYGRGVSETAEELGIWRKTAGHWRRRWLAAEASAGVAERFSDAPRCGAPATFTPEQICQIMVLACKDPERRYIPISHWSQSELVRATAHYLAHDTGRLAPGITCLIHAAARGVGHALVQLAKSPGAIALATVGDAAKAEFVKGVGADRVILYRDEDFVAAVKSWGDGKGVDVAYGCGETGNAGQDDPVLAAARAGGAVWQHFRPDRVDLADGVGQCRVAVLHSSAPGQSHAQCSRGGGTHERSAGLHRQRPVAPGAGGGIAARTGGRCASADPIARHDRARTVVGALRYG